LGSEEKAQSPVLIGAAPIQSTELNDLGLKVCV